MADYRETLYEGYGQQLRIDELLHEGHTDQQHLVIFRNARFGRVMALDGVVQTTEADEFIYHETLAHVPILAHGAVRRVLVIALCREHLPQHSAGALDDPRLRLVIGDGLDFVATTEERFDVIISDSTDPGGPASSLFGADFYRNCQRCLNADGVLATQNGVPFLQPDELSGTARHLAATFADWGFFLAAVPTYIGGAMSFGWASNSHRARATDLATLQQRFAASGLRTRYYNAEVHQAAFALPQYMRELIEG